MANRMKDCQSYLRNARCPNKATHQWRRIPAKKGAPWRNICRKCLDTKQDDAKTKGAEIAVRESA